MGKCIGSNERDIPGTIIENMRFAVKARALMYVNSEHSSHEVDKSDLQCEEHSEQRN
jgi:hypothetical protein